MYELFRESFFGRIGHFVSGGKLFLQEEQRDPSRLQRYIVTKSASDSDTSVERHTDELNRENATLEKGKDFELIDWLENDPEV
jgi:hypothetical protein